MYDKINIQIIINKPAAQAAGADPPTMKLHQWANQPLQ